ncbi:MAG: hypothetical protein PT977_11660 [Acidobacteriota bacterium]|nr:hypothetical protein [Acidobacteriota bacterium]
MVDHYASGGLASPARSSLVKGFAITAEEKADLIAFLESLTDVAFLENPLFGDPWKD